MAEDYDGFTSNASAAALHKAPVPVVQKSVPKKPVSTATSRQAAMARQRAAARRQAAARAALRRAAELRAAKIRRGAYQALLARQKALMVKMKPKPVQDSARAEGIELQRAKDKRYEALIADQKRQAAKYGREETRQVVSAKASRMNETLTAAERRRWLTLNELAKTRDYESVLKSIRAQQKKSGGRYLDRDLYEQVIGKYQVDRAAVDKAFAPVYQKALAAYNKKDWKALKAIQESAEWKSKLAAYVAVYGDGRKTGSAEKVSVLLQEIARANDDYFERSIFGYADAATRVQVNAAREETERALTVTKTRRVQDENGTWVTETYKVRRTLKEYLDSLEAEARDDMVEKQRVFLGHQRMLKQEGFEVSRSGRITDKAWTKEVQPVLRRALGNDYAALMKVYQNGNQVDSARALQEIIRRAMAARKAELESIRGSSFQVDTVGRNAGRYGASPAASGNTKLLEQFRQQLYLQLTGQAAPTGFGEVLEQSLQAPLLGEVLKGFAVGGSAITGGLRWLQTALGDNEYYVDAEGKAQVTNETGGRVETLDFMGLQGTNPLDTSARFRWGEGRTSQQEIQHEIQAKLDFSRVVQEAHGDLGKILEGIISYGAEPTQGNVGNFALQAVLDPTIAFNFTKFLGAGRLATARAGGLKAFLSHPNLALADWYKLTLPKSVGGFGKEVFTRRMALLDLSKELGRKFRDVTDLDDDAMQAALQNLIEHPRTIAEATSFIEKQFKVTSVNAQQILTSVQEYARKAAATGKLNLRVVDSHAFEAAVKAGESIGRTAPGEVARASRAVLGETLAESRTKAVHDVRKARARAEGKPAPAAPRVPVVTPAKRRIATVERQKYEAHVVALKDVSDRARAAVKLLDDSTDPIARRRAYDELTAALVEHENLMARHPDPAGGYIPSTLDRARESYEQAVASAGLPTRPNIAIHNSVELAKDIRFTDERIAVVRSRLAGTTGTTRSRLGKQLHDLREARRALGEARDRNRGRAKTAKVVVQKGHSTAEAAIRRPRLAAKAGSSEGVVEEASRDFYRKLRGSDVEDDLNAIPDAAQRPIVESHIAALSAQPVRYTTSTGALVQALDDLRLELDGLTLWEAIDVLESVAATGNKLVDGALAALRSQARGFITISPSEWDLFIDLARHLHSEGAGIGANAFEKLDKRVQKSFRLHGIEKREGQLRFYGQPKKVTTGLRAVDSDVLKTAAKVKALRGSGVTLSAYDELHGRLWPTIGKRNTSEGLRRKAEKLAASSGKTFDEAYEEVYAVKLREEAAHALHAFAMKPQFDGWLPHEILRAFEEQTAATDLRIGRPKVTGFVQRSYRKSISELSGTAETYVDDPQYMARVLGGQVTAPGGFRLATPDEMKGIQSPVPVFVGPASHPGFAGDVRGWYQRGYGIFLRDDLSIGGGLKTAMHEYGHAVVESSRAARWPLVAAVDYELGRLRAALPQRLFTSAVGNDAELAAELFSLYHGRGLDLDFFDVATGTQVAVKSWDDIRAGLGVNDQMALDRVGALLAALPAPVGEDFGIKGYNVPPLHSRQAAYTWLTENGFWSPRTAEKVRSGGAIWSIEQEADFFETSFGFRPAWTDPDLIAPALDDPLYYNQLMSQFGFMDNGFELHAAALNLDSEGRAQAVAYGTHEDVGIKRGRTRQELRYWFEQRYGDLVTEKVPTPAGGTATRFKAVPWLMDAGSAEYKNWATRMIDDGKVIDPTLIKPEQMERFKAAYVSAIDRRLERLRTSGKVADADAWLPQEQMRFAIDVTNELLMTREWRSLLQRAPAGHRALRVVGELQRLLVVTQLAFPVMNLIDRFTVKQVLLMVANNSYRFWRSVDDDTQRTVSSLASLNIRERGLWDLRTASGWERLRNSDLDRKTRAFGLLDSIKDFGFEVSSWGEDSLKLNFGQRVYQDIRNDLVAEGMDLAQARIVALHQTRKRVTSFFPSLEDAGDLERAINQMVPFMSYNFRNQILGLKIVAGHPWLWNMQDHIGQLVESANDQSWAEEHPDGPPLPEKYKRRLLIRSGEDHWAIDLASFSDWFRGPEKFANASKAPDTVGDWLTTFFRVPHPVQRAFAAWLTDGETPWGTQASVSSFLPLADFLPGLFGPGETAGFSPVEFWSKQLFFKSFELVDPTKARAMVYFDLARAGRYTKANELLDAYPDVEAWIQENSDPAKYRFRPDGWKMSWFRDRSPAEIAARKEALAGLDRLNKSFDAALAELYDRPWSDELSELKKQRQAAVLRYLRDHPEIGDAQAMAMSWDDWLREMGQWATDDLITDFFKRDAELKPKRATYATELEYQRAVREYLDWRADYLKATPSITEALERTRNELQRAWNEQQHHWDEIVRQQVDVRISILEEQAKGAGQDRDLVDLLYDLSDTNYTRLDAEAFANLYEGADATTDRLIGRADALIGAVRSSVVLPGRSDMFFDRADETERLKIEKDDLYRASIKKVLDKYGKDFYAGLEKEGLLNEYLKRNPDKRAAYNRYKTGRRYYLGIQAIFKNSTSGKDFYARLANDPWLQDQYYARHPDKLAAKGAGTQYFNAMKRWVKLLDAKDYDEAKRFFDGLPAWIKDKYYAKHPKNGQGAVRSSAYAAAMGGWVKLLEAKKFTEAAAYFKNLPAEFRERYFAKHPEARGRFGGDDKMIADAQAYFAADDAGKAAILKRSPAFATWLRVQGGDEEKRRGLILAAYRALPKEDAWIRRVYREKYPEIFSQEALGLRRLESVARKLAAHPELFDAYNEWVQFHYAAYQENLKHSGAVPRPLTGELLRRHRHKARSRRRRHAQYHVGDQEAVA